MSRQCVGSRLGHPSAGRTDCRRSTAASGLSTPSGGFPSLLTEEACLADAIHTPSDKSARSKITDVSSSLFSQ
ncbi:hypothetical protein NPIL_171691, partial [Nephila pilipes]